MSDKQTKLDELEQKLYARDPDMLPEKRVGVLRPLYKKVSSTWGSTEISQKEQKSSQASKKIKIFFTVSVLFFLIAGALILYSVIRGPLFVSGENIDIRVFGNTFTDSGVPSEMTISVTNLNATTLKNTVLIIEYPDGAREGGEHTKRERHNLGDIGQQGTRTHQILPTFYGQRGDKQQITFLLEYSLEGSQNRFVKQSQFEVTLASSPVDVQTEGQTTVSAGQPFSIIIKTTLDETTTLEDAFIRVEYPTGFTFQSATPAPLPRSSWWEHGDFAPGAYRTITLRGRLDAPVGEERAFRISFGTRENLNRDSFDVLYTTVLHTVIVEEPFIDTSMTVNNSSESVISLETGDRVQGLIRWRVASPIPIADPRIRLRVVGSRVDEGSFQAENAVFNTFEKEIQWESSALLAPGTALLFPGATGQLPFSFQTKEGSVGDTITLTLSIEGTFPERAMERKVVNTIEEKTIQFAARLQATAQAFYSIGPFQNTGPFPSKANQKTTYTITWTVRPSEITLENALFTAVLPPSVTWLDRISPEGAAITYDSTTRTVTWNLGVLIRANPEVARSQRASFQVSVTPPNSSVGQSIVLLGPTRYSATDTSLGTSIQTERPTLTTEIIGDPRYSPGDEIVLP